MKKLFIAAILTVLGTEAVAKGDPLEYMQRMEACSAVPDSAERLECFEARVKEYKEGGTVEAEAGATGSQWVVQRESSALDGRKDVFITTTSENLQPNAIGSPEKGGMAIRCMKNTTTVLFFHEIYFNDGKTISYRVGSGPVKKIYTQATQGGGGLGIGGGAKSIPFIREMIGKDELAVELKGYDQNVELVFDISGLDQHIGELAEACNWKP